MSFEHKLEKIKETFLTEKDVSFLSPLGESKIDELQMLMDEYIQKIEDAQKPIYKTMAFATQFIPNFIVAKIAQEMLGPYIVAQVTSQFKPKDAAKLGTNFDKKFLGEVALYAEKTVLVRITEELPFDFAFAIMQIMLDKGYYSRVAELADQLSDTLLSRFLHKFSNPVDVAKITIQMENEELIYKVFQKEKIERIQNIVKEIKNLGREDLVQKFFTKFTG